MFALQWGLCLLVTSLPAFVASSAGLADLLRIYDATTLREGLSVAEVDLTDQCALDMDLFLEKLDEKKIWALKGE